ILCQLLKSGRRREECRLCLQEKTPGLRDGGPDSRAMRNLRILPTALASCTIFPGTRPLAPCRLVADSVRTLSLVRVERAVQVFDGHGVLQAIPLVLINSACPERPCSCGRRLRYRRLDEPFCGSLFEHAGHTASSRPHDGARPRD